MAYKRKYNTSTFSRRVRRRRLGSYRTVRNRFSRRRRVQTISGQSGTIRNTGFRSKRLRRGAWKRYLWRSTLNDPHYRTLFADSNLTPTPANINTCTIDSARAIGNNFWTIPQGLQQLDNGVTPPTFVGDITLRGGVSKIMFSNSSSQNTGDAVKVNLYMVWTNRNPDFSILPTIALTGWDPSLIPDFERLGKVIGTREFWCLPGAIPMEVLYRYTPRKVDQAIHNAGGEQLLWVYALSGSQNLTDQVEAQATYNLSFSADAGQPGPVPLVNVVVQPPVVERLFNNPRS